MKNKKMFYAIICIGLVIILGGVFYEYNIHKKIADKPKVQNTQAGVPACCK